MINTGRFMDHSKIREEDLVTIASFISKVTAMRAAKQSYFRERKHSYLQQSKAIEKEVDNMKDKASQACTRVYISLFNQ